MKLNSDPADIEFEDKPFKTIQDYYKEIDAERERSYDSNNGSIPFEKAVGYDNSNNINLLNGINHIDDDQSFGQQILGNILNDDF